MRKRGFGWLLTETPEGWWDVPSETAKQLWDSLPPVYRQCAVVYTDYWDAYGCVVSYRVKTIELSARRLGKQIILRDSTTLYVRERPA